MTTLFFHGAARPAANNSVPSLWLLISRVAARKKCGRAVFRMVQLMPASPSPSLPPLPPDRYAQSSCHPRFSTVQGETGKMNGRIVDDFGWRRRRIALRESTQTFRRGKWEERIGTMNRKIGETINSQTDETLE